MSGQPGILRHLWKAFNIEEKESQKKYKEEKILYPRNIQDAAKEEKSENKKTLVIKILLAKIKNVNDNLTIHSEMVNT
jgi:hypothetical protein